MLRKQVKKKWKEIKNKHVYTKIYLNILNIKKANGVKYADAIEEVNDIVKHVKTSIDKVLNEVCCICGEELKDFGNNPYPISDEGRCCDKCNDKVIEARIVALKGE